MMHNVTSRLNSAFFFGVTVIGVLAALNLATSFLIEQNLSVQISNVNVTKLVKNTRAGWDEADITFDLHADLSGVFNWNIKLVFLYMEMEYYALDRNQVVFWDKIVWRDQNKPMKLDLIKEKGKYTIRTQKHNLKGTTAAVKLRLEVTPIAGFVYKLQSEPVLVTFPNNYS